jgi:hypothetical protein
VDAEGFPREIVVLVAVFEKGVGTFGEVAEPAGFHLDLDVLSNIGLLPSLHHELL